MFALLNYLTAPVQQNILDPSMFSNLLILENVFLGAFALVGGIFMDSVGRKRLAIIGFVMLGLSYSILGFFPTTPVWCLATIMNGISWGILYVLFVVTIWGDLSHGAPSDKFYALGVSPFFISKMLQLTIDSQIVAAIPISAIFSFTALFLFLAVLPLIYAPETLPEKVIKQIELNSYLEQAQKVKEKYA
jgi:MFS family permease